MDRIVRAGRIRTSRPRGRSLQARTRPPKGRLTYEAKPAHRFVNRSSSQYSFNKIVRYDRTRATRPETRLVKKLPRIGTVQSSNPSRLNHGRIKVAKVDAHPVASTTDGLPVRHASAHCAPTERQAFVTPNVAVERTSAGHDLHPALVVVAPQPGVATTN